MSTRTASASRVVARWLHASFPGEVYQQISGDDFFVVDDASDTRIEGWRIDAVTGQATAESYEDDYGWEGPFERVYEEHEYESEKPSARAQLQIDALAHRGKPIVEMSPVWHVTSSSSARSILSGGFKAQPTRKGPGVSVSVSLPAAKGLLATLRRMNSFRSHDQVYDWYQERGVSEEKVARARADFERRPPSYGSSPAALYLRMMSQFHPAVGGKARIPYNEFLWSDIGSHLIGKPIVVVEAVYGGPVPAFGANAIEAEMFLSGREAQDSLVPERVSRTL